ncbi:MAG: GGDEF domain-containing protein [Deltaproteobacteria bacterium]|nr:GGDEF domain-containing protein [Deltaproteobacteria bacterium]
MDNINEEFIRASKANNNSIIDPLTGIYNRRHFDAVLDKIYSENNDDGALSIMIIDIDHFKKFNDTYGHDVGDEVLKTVVNTVRKNIRHNLDMFFRFGGEEFIIITSDDKDGSLKLAEKLNKLEYKAVERVTISIGVAVYQKGISKTELIKIADNNLYRAKENGRNQVVY